MRGKIMWNSSGAEKALKQTHGNLNQIKCCKRNTSQYNKSLIPRSPQPLLNGTKMGNYSRTPILPTLFPHSAGSVARGLRPETERAYTPERRKSNHSALQLTWFWQGGPKRSHQGFQLTSTAHRLSARHFLLHFLFLLESQTLQREGQNDLLPAGSQHM